MKCKKCLLEGKICQCLLLLIKLFLEINLSVTIWTNKYIKGARGSLYSVYFLSVFRSVSSFFYRRNSARVPVRVTER